METHTQIDMAIAHQVSQRRANALAAIARYRTPSYAAAIPVWFGVGMALLIACVPISRPNPIPYVVGMLAFAVLWVTANMIRNNRRLEAIVQLIIQDSQN
jgi:hypothetical protein